MMSRLLWLVDEDTEAFNKIMAVFAMPKSTDEEKAARAAAMQEATLYATQVPLETIKATMDTFPLIRAMAEEGNPNSVSDAGVGALAARAAVLGACLNVKINAGGLKDREVHILHPITDALSEVHSIIWTGFWELCMNFIVR